MPPAILISLAENAVKHGLERATRSGTVTIAARVEDGASLRVSGAPEGGVEAVLTLPLAATGA